MQSVARGTSPSSRGIEQLTQTLGSVIFDGMPLSAAVDMIVTQGGRIGHRLGRAALSSRQRALLEAGADLVIQTETETLDAYSQIWWLGLSPHGGLELGVRRPTPPNGRTLGWVGFNEEVNRRFRSIVARLEAEEECFRAEMSSFFERASKDDLKAASHALREAIDHVDPVLIYVEDRRFMSLPNFDNLLGRGGQAPSPMLAEPTHLAPECWSSEERTFFYCAHLMLRVGWRLEEFCGCQLTLRVLNVRFDVRLRAWACHPSGSLPASSTATAGVAPGTLQEKAELVRARRAELKKGHFAYRWVNGISFYKEERWASRAAFRKWGDAWADALARSVSYAFSAPSNAEGTLESYFGACVKEALEAQPAGTYPDLFTGVEWLIGRVVASAMADLRADIGMARGIRDLYEWRRAIERNDVQRICDWTPTAYYCGVLASRRIVRRFCDRGQQAALIKVLRAVSKRMQFNSWHYMPGHFDPALVPAGRHFYYPPRMTDTAEWSNFHHAGHVLADVRYSIRAPAPLLLHGRKWFGMVDVRMMRSGGEPFTRAELIRARQYAGCIRAIAQAVLDSNHDSERAQVRAFTNEWYERHGLDAIYAIESADYGHFCFGGLASLRDRPGAGFIIPSLSGAEGGEGGARLWGVKREPLAGESRSPGGSLD